MIAEYQDTPMDDWPPNVIACAAIIMRALKSGPCCLRDTCRAMREAIRRLRERKKIDVIEVDGVFHIKRICD